MSDEILQVAIGEIAAHKDYIQTLKRELQDAGVDVPSYTGPRGAASYATDNHVVSVYTIARELFNNTTFAHASLHEDD